MSAELDLHPANADERAQAFANVHDVWGRGLSPEEHLRRRLGNLKYEDATWYVGTLNGRVVTACGCYHVPFRIDGTIEPTSAIGAVHTLAEFRGRGFAPRLLAYAESQQRAAGKTFSLLYSDISPAYYARMGFQPCAASHGWVKAKESTATATAHLVPFNPKEELPWLVETYDRDHEELSLSVARSPTYWRYLLDQEHRDEFYLVEAGGKRIGYVRVGPKGGDLLIRDVGFTEKSDEARRDLYSAVIELARSRGVDRVGGWMPDDAVCQSLFQVADRVEEFTMIKPLVDRLKIEDRHRRDTQYIHEIDHV